MTLEQLRARLKELVAEAKTLAEAGDLSAEQQTQFDNLTAEHTAVKGKIDRLEKALDMEGDLNASSGRQAAPAAPSAQAAPAAPGTIIVPGHAVARDQAAEGMGGFTDMADFAQSVKRACSMGGSVDQRLVSGYGDINAAPTNFHQEQGSTQGYDVPPAMRQHDGATQQNTTRRLLKAFVWRRPNRRITDLQLHKLWQNVRVS